MKVILNSISGFDDAIEAMYFSKRTWTPELHKTVKEICDTVLRRDGSFRPCTAKEKSDKFNMWLDMICRMTVNHITIGKFIDFSFTVEGLHRGGQDDWDSHAERFDNRIIRSSTRLAKFGAEKSDYYKEKIMTTDEVLKNILSIETPNEIEYNGNTYVKTVNGYIQKNYENSNDVRRGLYMLSIPSNFIFKVNLTQFAHVYKERNNSSGANPEVKECAEKCLALLNESYPQFNRELMLKIKN